MFIYFRKPLWINVRRQIQHNPSLVARSLYKKHSGCRIRFKHYQKELWCHCSERIPLQGTCNYMYFLIDTHLHDFHFLYKCFYKGKTLSVRIYAKYVHSYLHLHIICSFYIHTFFKASELDNYFKNHRIYLLLNEKIVGNFVPFSDSFWFKKQKKSRKV